MSNVGYSNISNAASNGMTSASGNNFNRNFLNPNVNVKTSAQGSEVAELTFGDVARMGILAQMNHPLIKYVAEQRGQRRIPISVVKGYDVELLAVGGSQRMTPKWKETALFPRNPPPDIGVPPNYYQWMENDHAQSVPPRKNMKWIPPEQRHVYGCLNFDVTSHLEDRNFAEQKEYKNNTESKPNPGKNNKQKNNSKSVSKNQSKSKNNTELKPSVSKNKNKNKRKSVDVNKKKYHGIMNPPRAWLTPLFGDSGIVIRSSNVSRNQYSNTYTNVPQISWDMSSNNFSQCGLKIRTTYGKATGIIINELTTPRGTKMYFIPVPRDNDDNSVRKCTSKLPSPWEWNQNYDNGGISAINNEKATSTLNQKGTPMSIAYNVFKMLMQDEDEDVSKFYLTEEYLNNYDGKYFDSKTVFEITSQKMPGLAAQAQKLAAHALVDFNLLMHQLFTLNSSLTLGYTRYESGTTIVMETLTPDAMLQWKGGFDIPNKPYTDKDLHVMAKEFGDKLSAYHLF